MTHRIIVKLAYYFDGTIECCLIAIHPNGRIQVAARYRFSLN